MNRLNNLKNQEWLENQDNKIRNFIKSTWEIINFFIQKGIELKLTRRQINKTLLIILWSSILAKPVLARNIYITWGMDKSKNNIISWYEVRYYNKANKDNESAWEIKTLLHNEIPPGCVKDPDNKKNDYEWFIYTDMPWTLYFQLKWNYNEWWSTSYSPVFEVLDTNNYDFSRIKFDFNKNWKKDILEYSRWNLYSKYLGGENWLCVWYSKWDWDTIKFDYSTWNKILTQTNNWDDNKPDITLYNKETHICDTDLSYNWFNWIDTSQECDFPNRDTVFYKEATWKMYLWLMNNDWTNFTFKPPMTWDAYQKVESLENKNKKGSILTYKTGTWEGSVYTLNEAEDWFNKKDIQWATNLELINLWDIEGKGLILWRSTNGWQSYLCKFNPDTNEFFDKKSIKILSWEIIKYWDFTNDGRKSIIRHNKTEWKIIIVTINSDLSTDSEKEFNIESWTDIEIVNLRWLGIDDIVSFNKTIWLWKIYRFKENNPWFYEFSFWWLPTWLDIYKWKFGKKLNDSLLFYNKQGVNWISDVFFLLPNNKWNWFIEPYTHKTWEPWSDIYIWDIDWSLRDWIKLYEKSSWRTYIIKVEIENNIVVLNIKKLRLGSWYEIIEWEFDNR